MLQMFACHAQHTRTFWYKKPACSVQKSILKVFPKLFPFLASLADYDTLEVLKMLKFTSGVRHTVGTPEVQRVPYTAAEVVHRKE